MTKLSPKPNPEPAPAVGHAALAGAIRALSMDAVERAKSGHPGMPMGMADVATVLFTEFLKLDPAHPTWPDRDRFVLSAGHGSMLQYALHYLLGYEDMTLEELKHFRQLGSKTAGHPEYGHAAGIETTTGPLGQGFANAVGMALAERMLAAEFAGIVDHYTYVIAGDGCLMEGISHEAASLAGHLQLNKLIVLFDDNGISIDGPTSLTVSDDHLKRFEAQGWRTEAIDGHDAAAIRAALARAQNSDKPSFIACKTVIAKGAPTKAGSSASHGSPLGEKEIEGARKNLEWPYAPFEIPAEILARWREAGARGTAEYEAWQQQFSQAPEAVQAEFSARIAGDLGDRWTLALDELKQKLATDAPKEATRQSSQNLLNALAPHLPALVGGSADLTGSNNTKAGNMAALAAPDYQGRYVYYGVREHAMAAAMNGIALHGGFVPYGGTFLVFTDYCRPAIRLSALMQQRVIYVMTHDSIGLGEDGPTHQPVEHLASLRAIPNLDVLRPADATETAECWALALSARDHPSILALSRQAVPSLRRDYVTENLSARGAYILREASSDPRVVLIGTGTELYLCVEAQAQLEAKGIPTRVVSMPSMTRFVKEPKRYQQQVLGEGSRRIAVEAALGMGWERWLGEDGIFIGMTGFGASAPAPDLYQHFGITVEAIVKAAESGA
ncbi:MAG: transketolase [Alphaproteobacteria bacterium]|jgi:transketolase